MSLLKNYLSSESLAIAEELKAQQLTASKLEPIKDLGDLSSDEWDVLLFSLHNCASRDLQQKFFVTRMHYEGKKRES